MDPVSKEDVRARTGLTLARTTCLCMGFGLMLWGLAPALVERLLTGNAPSPQSLSMGAFAAALGLTFLALASQIRQRRLWSLWTAFALSTAITAMGIVLVTVMHLRPTSSFIMLLSGWTAFANWLGIAAVYRQRAHPDVVRSHLSR